MRAAGWLLVLGVAGLAVGGLRLLQHSPEADVPTGVLCRGGAGLVVAAAVAWMLRAGTLPDPERAMLARSPRRP